MTPLRIRMLEDMQLKGYSPRTQEAYSNALRELAAQDDRRPPHLDASDAPSSPHVFRIAISNSRLVRFENGQVTFRYRDNRSSEVKHCVVPAADFIARFLQHVLPRGFTKVRHSGVYSPLARRISSKPAR